MSWQGHEHFLVIFLRDGISTAVYLVWVTTKIWEASFEGIIEKFCTYVEEPVTREKGMWHKHEKKKG